MTEKKKKRDKPLKVDMDFDEMVSRIARVKKGEVDRNITKKKDSKK
ncbi:MAG: hypothetical protein ACI9JN_001908 [Bacteroidia bacterium]|jgi:hypothetical protein